MNLHFSKLKSGRKELAKHAVKNCRVPGFTGESG